MPKHSVSLQFVFMEVILLSLRLSFYQFLLLYVGPEVGHSGFKRAGKFWSQGKVSGHVGLEACRGGGIWGACRGEGWRAGMWGRGELAQPRLEPSAGLSVMTEIMT